MRKKSFSIVFRAFVILFVSAIVFPFVWLLLGSFKNMKELFSIPVTIFPSQIEWSNYSDVFVTQPFAGYIVNSLIISFATTLIIIVIGTMASFSLQRTEIKGKKLFLIMLLSITLLPPITLLNPLYYLLSSMKLLNTRSGLTAVLVAIELPAAVWYLISFFQSIPVEMEESAMLDGATVLQTFNRILLPLIAPGIFTISIMTFINAWNNYIFAMVLNGTKAARTITVGIALFRTETYTPWHTISAAAITVCVPLVVVILIFQKRIISGIMEGSVKG